MSTSLRGVNLTGAEYAYDPSVPPVLDSNYTWVSHQDIDYLASKGVTFAASALLLGDPAAGAQRRARRAVRDDPPRSRDLRDGQGHARHDRAARRGIHEVRALQGEPGRIGRRAQQRVRQLVVPPGAHSQGQPEGHLRADERAQRHLDGAVVCRRAGGDRRHPRSRRDEPDHGAGQRLQPAGHMEPDRTTTPAAPRVSNADGWAMLRGSARQPRRQRAHVLRFRRGRQRDRHRPSPYHRATAAAGRRLGPRARAQGPSERVRRFLYEPGGAGGRRQRDRLHGRQLRRDASAGPGGLTGRRPGGAATNSRSVRATTTRSTIRRWRGWSRTSTRRP